MLTSAPSTASEALLGTMGGVSATFVAILGGLLVTRLLNLFSEQGNADQLLADASDRLGTAIRRAADAIRERDRYDAGIYFQTREVAQAVVDGVTAAAGLLQVDDKVDLSPEELQTFLDDASTEAGRARELLEGRLPFRPSVPSADWAALDWEEVRPIILQEPLWWGYSEIWKITFSAIVKDRVNAAKIEEEKSRAEAREAARQRRKPQKLGDLFAADLGSLMLPKPSPGRFALPNVLGTITPASVIQARNQRRAELRSNVDRTKQRVEDLEEEVRRVQRLRGTLSRPNWQVIVGLAVLALGTVSGVLLPVFALAKVWTISLGWLLSSFTFSVVAPTIFMAVLAVGSLRRTRRQESQGRSPVRKDWP